MSYAKLTLIGLTFKRIGTAWARRHDSAYAGAYALQLLDEWLTPHAWSAMGKILYGGVGWGNDDMQTR